jgi:hypothetical protein
MNVDDDTRLEMERKDKKGAQAEKRTVIGLTLAFAVAVKHCKWVVKVTFEDFGADRRCVTCCQTFVGRMACKSVAT